MKRNLPAKKKPALLGTSAGKGLMSRIEQLIPRETLNDILRVIDDHRIEPFLDDLMHPRDGLQQRRTLFGVARMHGITGPELVNWIRKAHIDIGIILASQRIPQIMTDIAEDALNHTGTCWRCDGHGIVEVSTGKHSHEEKCSECHGTGQIKIQGDIENRKLALETTGLIQRRSGAFVNVPISFGGAPVDSFESLVSKAGDIIESIATPVPALPEGTSES